MGKVIKKEVLVWPWNRALLAFALQVGPYTFVSHEEEVCIYNCIPGYIDPDTGNDWEKVTEHWEEENNWQVVCPKCGYPWWVYGSQEPVDYCLCCD